LIFQQLNQWAPLLSFVFDIGTIVIIWIVKNTLVSHQDFVELRERVVRIEARPVIDNAEIRERLGAIESKIEAIEDLQRHNREVLEVIQRFMMENPR
jgi:tetrahydromethanopterin S-methyltransferase subunit G